MKAIRLGRLALPCGCPHPMVFEGSESCTRCGHTFERPVSPSTQRLALAIARVILKAKKET